MNEAHFAIGTIIKHKLFNYYGVIYDVDAIFMGSEDWYENVARTKPPKDKPWYHILVDEQGIETYVAERNLESCKHFREISHPLVDVYFNGRDKNQYAVKSPMV